jgi:hypothetical protein
MRQPSSIEPFTPSPTIVLHPALQAALDNLDVQIEEELTRYRRQRRYPTATTPRRKPLPTASGATAIGILKHNIQLPMPRSSIYESQVYDSPAVYSSQAAPQSAEPQSAKQAKQSVRQTVASPIHQSVERPTTSSVPQGVEFSVAKSGKSAVPTLESTLHPSPASVVSTAEARISEPEQTADELASARIASYAEQNDLSAYAPSSTLQKLIQQPVPYSAPDAPDDYLASSEELLRSIAEEDRELGAERDPNTLLDTLLTPLGVGSMLLLVLASTTVGYVIMNPTSLGLWTPDATPEPSADKANPSANPAATGSETTNETTGDKAAPSPDLASDEFVDLDLDTLSTLPKQSRSKAQSAKAAKPKSSSANPNSANPTAARSSASNIVTSTAASPSTPSEIPVAPEPQPSLSTVVVPAAPPVMSVPEPAEPAPAPAPVSPEPISTAPPPIEPDPVESASSEPAPVEPAPAPSVATAPAAQSNSYYYVVTEYSGDASLQEARGAVPDAYVRNLPSEGAKVQLGAFSDETKAQELLQQLQQQGIEAEVYTP